MGATDAVYLQRIATCFVSSFVFLAVISKALGEERKAKWFRKRTKFSFFLRRGVLGEWMHFGYPCTKEGMLVFVATFGTIFSASYFYIFR